MKNKMRDIEKLFSAARAGKGAKKKGSGTSRADQYKQKGPRLDARMRKDKRGTDKVAKRMKASGKGKAAAAGAKRPPPPGKNRRR